MEIKIFNVTDGFCAYIIADNRNVMLIDCGHNQDNGFRPSTYLRERGCTGIERFIVSNYDEDHLSDLPDLRDAVPIQVLRRNKSVSADVLRSIKARGGPLAPGTRVLLDMMETYASEVVPGPDFAGIEMLTFHNSYPTFDDTNNLSLVTFLHYRDIHIIFPGDLEKPGWEELLKNWAFRQQLEKVNIFVASHHGRENGYCPDVFEFCEPEIAIISDGPKRHETQNTNHLYKSHADGTVLNGELRYVLTTRSDGMLTIRQGPGDLSWHVDTSG